jgi:hypothetical protein
MFLHPLIAVEGGTPPFFIPSLRPDGTAGVYLLMAEPGRSARVLTLSRQEELRNLRSGFPCGPMTNQELMSTSSLLFPDKEDEILPRWN